MHSFSTQIGGETERIKVRRFGMVLNVWSPLGLLIVQNFPTLSRHAG